MVLWVLWTYFYLAFAFRLLQQVPLHLGFASCHDLGLNYWHFNNHELRRKDHQQCYTQNLNGVLFHV
jgi:hypothetical protein